MKSLILMALGGAVAAPVVISAVTAGSGESTESRFASLVGGSAGEYHGCRAPMPEDYVPPAEADTLAFDPAHATLDYSLARSRGSKYVVHAMKHVADGPAPTFRVSVAADAGEVTTFPATADTAFEIVGHRLYHTGEAGFVVAFDLTTGTELWRAARATDAPAALVGDDFGVTAVTAGGAVTLEGETGEVTAARGGN